MAKRRLLSLTGQKFGKWSVGEELPRVPGRHLFYKCTCDCGTVSEIDYYHLINLQSKQCKACITTTVCKNGHDISIVGREPNYKCKLCRVESHIRRTYGFTLEEYVALYAYQGGRCAICGRPLELNSAFSVTFGEIKPGEKVSTRAEMDHEHVPKRIKPQPDKKSTVRGLLCGGRYAGCNAKLGRVDNVEWLTSALAYLSDPPAPKILAALEGMKEIQERGK